MSEGDVSGIHDEDTLRRMWQQTEDFSKKKEIRAHMYRLREERLRNLYSPETIDTKGHEFTSPQGHTKSFADQTFQSMKSKEVRDAGSPPKEFTYRGQELKELSNAGWNVESDSRTTDDGHTRVRSVNANIEGSYDIAGGKGQFSAVDKQKQAVTEYHDDNTSIKRNESSSNTAAHEQISRKTDDGSTFSSKTSSSTSTSKYQQVSSTENQNVPYSIDNVDRSQQISSFDESNRSEENISHKHTSKTSNFEQNLRTDNSKLQLEGELLSRKVEYPDENTKVIVETRSLPDGTRVTSTRREFRGPVVQSNRSEQHSQQSKAESNTFTSTSSHEKKSVSNYNQDTFDSRIRDINKNENYVDEVTNNKKVYSDDDTQNKNTSKTTKIETKLEDSTRKETQRKHTEINFEDNHNISTKADENYKKVSKDLNTEKVMQQDNTNDQFQTTYQSDYTKKKISQDLSPTHQAWASTLRADTPASTHPSTRDSSPGSRTFQSSTSSLRSSISPDKTFRKPSSRGGSPSKVDRHSPTRPGPHSYSSNMYNENTITETRTTKHISPSRTGAHKISPTRSTGPNEKPQNRFPDRRSISPDKRSSERYSQDIRESRYYSISPERKSSYYRASPEKTANTDSRLSKSPERKPNYQQGTYSTEVHSSTSTTNKSKRISPDKTIDANTDYCPKRSISPSIAPESPLHETFKTTPEKSDTYPRSRTSPDRKTSYQHNTYSDEQYKSTTTSTDNLRRSSPEKISNDNMDYLTKRSTSPSKSTLPNTFRATPDKESVDTNSRPSTNPERKQSYQQATFSSERHFTTTNTSTENLKHISLERTANVNMDYPTKISTSPFNAPSSTLPDTYTATPDKEPDTNSRPSTSPERKPSYQQATFSSEQHSSTSADKSSYLKHMSQEETPNHNISYPKQVSPTRPFSSPERSKSPMNLHKTPLHNTHSKPNSETTTKHSKAASYRFVDEETKISTRFDKKIDYSEDLIDNTQSKFDKKVYQKGPSPSRQSPTKDSPGHLPSSLRKDSPTRRSPSPPKGPVKFESDVHEHTHKSDINRIESDTTSISNEYQNENYDLSLSTNKSEKVESTSLSKHGTYDKKYEFTINDQYVSKDKFVSPKEPEIRSSSPPQKTQKTPRSQSPHKTSPGHESKYKNTSTFITKERKTEECNKTGRNDRPRQLLTPSTSPTRKPKTVDAPSTGQSSPTTSVSEIIYFSSPRQTESKTIVTDLDDENNFSLETNVKTKEINVFNRPENIEVKKFPSPSKIPCRSPSPDKRVSPSNDNLPRKSSLKKTSEINNLSSTTAIEHFTEHKIVKKDRPDKDCPKSPKHKEKPPLERRETYEERCRKILGMVEENNAVTDSKTVKVDSIMRRNDSNITYDNNKRKQSSPNVSTCSSPIREPSPVTFNVNVKDIRVSDFINNEKTTLVKQSNDVCDNVTVIKNKSPSRDTSPTKLRDIISDTKINTNNFTKIDDIDKSINTKIKQHVSTNVISNIKDTPKQSRTSLSTKTYSAANENVEVNTEREQEILSKVQKSLRKLSPNRDSRSPSSEKVTKSTLVNQVDDCSYKAERESETTTKTKTDKTINKTGHVTESKKKEEQKSRSILSPRSVSPTKKPTAAKTDVAVPKVSPTRSSSPKKPASQNSSNHNLPHSQLSKPSTAKPKENIEQNKQLNTSKDKTCNETKKNATTLTKQNIFTKNTNIKLTNKVSQTSVNSKNIPKTIIPTIDGGSRKETDVKVTRTTSDNTIKTKKLSPQRLRSKPEIHVNDLSNTKRTIKQNIGTKTSQKSSMKETTKLSIKPKSATALNTTTNDDDVIIDVQQAKSSRENSPDRICPTPVSFLEDIGIPRLPDEVSEPDDDLLTRSHHTIHETESIVDDIVEIDEDEELFSKKSNVDVINESDECLLSVTDKVSKFSNKTTAHTKPKDWTSEFKDIETRDHSDFKNQHLNKDDCLLTVSEKVNKFANTKENSKTTPRNDVHDEYDINSTYQDDYTKLSVNDKANLFIESAENVLISNKLKPAQKVERLDFSYVDQSLESDDCLLSVSDKVNKFVKTAELFLNETKTIDSKEAIDINKHDNESKSYSVLEKSHTNDNYHNNESHEDEIGSFAKETVSSHAKVKDYVSPNLKVTDRAPLTKITTLRSSEAVKKAKAIFENMASTQEKSHSTKLTDIGVIKKASEPTTTETKPCLGKDLPKNIDTDIGVKQFTSDNYDHLNHYTDSQINKDDKIKTSSSRLTPTPTMSTQPRQKSPMRPLSTRAESPKRRMEPENIFITNQNKEESKIEESYDVTTRRGSGKFGVELRRTSLEKSVSTNDRRRSSTDQHQPCIEDIFDLDLLEQMLEKVVGYEQRRRIRAQIRVAKKKSESEQVIDTNTYTKHTAQKHNITYSTRNSSSPDRHQAHISKHNVRANKANVSDVKEFVPTNVPEKRQRPHSPEKHVVKPLTSKTRSPTRHSSPDKKPRIQSPSKTATKTKPNRFNEYASAYMKKVGLTDLEKANRTKEVEAKNTSNAEYEIKEEITKVTTNTSKTNHERSSSREIIHVVNVNGARSPSPEARVKRIQSPERKVQTGRLYQKSPSPDFKRPKTYSDITKKEIVHDIEKKIPPKNKQEEKPSWVSSRNLKKITETRSSNKKIETEKKYRSSSPSKQLDVITSSYGPGPLDADGRPLFGIKALRNGATNYQVKGTVIKQEFHSHNGGEPEGTVSVTAYSNNSDELEKLLQTHERPSRIHGLAAITTTKKFGGDTGTNYREVHNKEDRALLEEFTSHNRKAENDTFGDFIESQRIIELDDDNTSTTERTSSSRIKEVEDLRREDRRSQERHETRSFSNEKKSQSKKMEEKKTVRQSSVKSLKERFTKNSTDTSKSERSYPKAGLILRAATLKDSFSSDSHRQELKRTDSDRSINSGDGETMMETKTTTTEENTENGVRRTTTTTTKASRASHKSNTSFDKSHVVQKSNVSQRSDLNRNVKDNATRKTERSFLDSSTKVTGVQDILSRMKNADIVIEDGDTNEDTEARALLNKFLGATVLMAGMQNYVEERPGRAPIVTQKAVKSNSHKTVDIENCWDERVLRNLLEESSDYEQRRRIRGRIRSLMAEQEACASAVAEALESTGAGDVDGDAESVDTREEEVTTVTSSVRRNSSEKTVSSSTTTECSKVIDSMTRSAPKAVSPFAKFRQLEKQNSTTNPSSPKTPQSPGSPSQPFFKFTDPALACSAITIKERLLQWCRDKTREYENVKLENFSTSWSDGLAFCALIHHFLPKTFDYSKLTPEKRRQNFTLAFKVADEKAGIYPLLDVDDMVAMRKPDWKCVFTYVQAIYRRFKDED